MRKGKLYLRLFLRTGTLLLRAGVAVSGSQTSNHKRLRTCSGETSTNDQY